jgi:beta-glucanase (GH16 family)
VLESMKPRDVQGWVGRGLTTAASYSETVRMTDPLALLRSTAAPRRRPHRSGPAGRSVALVAALVVGVAGALAACGGAGSATGAATPAATGTASPWHLVWADEFNGSAGTAPDAARWGYDLGDNNGWGNGEREYYTRDAANAAQDGKGNLVITARQADGSQSCYYGQCEYTSARLLTQGIYTVQYGLVEARIKVPAGAGLWPAFWLLGSNIGEAGWPGCGEIDVMENVGRNPNTLYGTIHGPGYSGASGLGGTTVMTDPLSAGYHVYAVEWKPDSVTWTVDDKQYFTAAAADVAPNEWVFNHDFFVILNLAVGGSFGGAVSPDTAFPAAMAIDYVRVYQLSAGAQ